MHDNFTLADSCSRDVDIAPFFVGVFAADDAPDRIANDSILVLNTDRRNLPGTHWVLVVRLARVAPAGVFFDSYGRLPSSYDPAWKRFDLFDRTVVDYQQQHTDVCGDYCLFAAKKMVSGCTLTQTVRRLRPDDRRFNDEQVYALVHGEFKNLNNVKHVTVVKLGDKRTRALAFYQHCKSRR